MNEVLAAIDLTPLGRRVADRARLVAENLEVGLGLLYVIEPMGEAFIPDEVVDMLRRNRMEAAEELAGWIRSRSTAPVSMRVVKGSPVWEIVREAKGAEVTIVGSSAADRLHAGPVAMGVAANSRGSMLLVRRQPRVPYRKVVVAVDLSEASAHAVELAMVLGPEAEVRLVFALPTRFDAHMTDAGMFPEEIESSRRHRLADARRALDEYADRWEGVSAAVLDGPPVEAIEEEVRRRGADLLVAASRGAGATRMTLLGTVAAGVLDRAPCDVAIARVPGEFRRP